MKIHIITTYMKMEEDTKIIGWMPICSFVGIIVGIIIACCLEENIGIGILLGWAIGFFVGAVIANIVYRLKKSRSEDEK